MEYISSPLNYVGNKFKLLDEIIPLLPQNINTFVEPFAGSAMVSLNYKPKKIILNDFSEHTTQLLNYFNEFSFEEIIKKTEIIIKEYNFTDTFHNGYSIYPTQKNSGLSTYNKLPYTNLKNDYNNKPTVEKLFVLVLFGFNHYIRFNKSGKFNVPVGKVDFSKIAREKTEKYISLFKDNNITIHNLDFLNPILYNSLNENDFVYCDPPYLITNAPYNSIWEESLELKLFSLLDELNKKNIKFALSNVTENNGKENTLLKEWLKNYNCFYLNKDYKTANYRRKNQGSTKEVLITNYTP